MSKLIYKPTKPYTEDINDLVEKGGKGSGIRGHRTAKPEGSLKKESYKGFTIERTGGSYTRMTESGPVTESTPYTTEFHIYAPNGQKYHTEYSSIELARKQIDKLTQSEDSRKFERLAREQNKKNKEARQADKEHKQNISRIVNKN